jgi:hypothetical protein
MLLATGVWTYVVLGVMLVAGIVLLRALLVPAHVGVARRVDLLDDNHRRLYQALQVWSGERWLIFCTVPLIALVQPKGAASFRRSWYESLAQHTVDFVLCDPLSTKIGIAITLGPGAPMSTASNEKATTAFVADVLRRAGIQWVEIPVKQRYSADEIQQYING